MCCGKASLLRAGLVVSFLELFVDMVVGATVSVDPRVVSVDDLDAEEDRLKSTGCVWC